MSPEDKAEAICKARGWRLAISGMEWERIPEFAPYAIGHCISGEMAAHLSRRSVISVHANGETLFHNRPLETFAAGGFTLSWCPGDLDSDGLDLPLFCMADIEEKFVYWMENNSKREAETERIGEAVRRIHTFDNLVKKLLAHK